MYNLRTRHIPQLQLPLAIEIGRYTRPYTQYPKSASTQLHNSQKLPVSTRLLAKI